jgi:putative CocE/NonD family hydrolase
MSPTQPATGRYQLLQGPWYHLTAGANFDIYALQLRWFDRWLKGEQTGIDRSRAPLHLWELGANRWVDAIRYPLSQTTPTTFYLSGGPSHSGALSLNDGTLQTAAPSNPLGSDQEVFTNATSPCDRNTAQWSLGASELPFANGQLPPEPCANDDRTLELGPGALTYTSAPFSRPTVLAGPIDATIYASSTTPDTELVATVEDVSPDGTSTPISSGALLDSFRALDTSQTWFAPDGKPLLPYHPYTQASAAPVPVGSVTRFDIEVFPVVDELLAGHRLRLTLTTSDTPHLLPLAGQLSHLVGGIYQIQRNAGAASFLEVPLADASAFPAAASPSAGSSSRTRSRARPKNRARFQKGHRRARTGPAFTG